MVITDTQLLFLMWKPAAVEHFWPDVAKRLHDGAAGVTHRLAELLARKNRFLQTHWGKERAQKNLRTVDILHQIYWAKYK